MVGHLPLRRSLANEVQEMDGRLTARTGSPVIDRDAIARRAHDIFVSRGATHGQDVEDWLMAEAQLREELAQKGEVSASPQPSRSSRARTSARSAGKGRGRPTPSSRKKKAG
jgi:hypothetical protein